MDTKETTEKTASTNASCNPSLQLTRGCLLTTNDHLSPRHPDPTVPLSHKSTDPILIIFFQHLVGAVHCLCRNCTNVRLRVTSASQPIEVFSDRYKLSSYSSSFSKLMGTHGLGPRSRARNIKSFSPKARDDAGFHKLSFVFARIEHLLHLGNSKPSRWLQSVALNSHRT